MTRRQKLFYGFSAILTLALFLIGRDQITNVISDPSVSEVNLSQLQEVYRDIPIHEGDVYLKQQQSFDKGSIRGVSARLQSKLSRKELVSHYVSVLSAFGWAKSSENFDSNDYQIKFCKGNISIIIETQASPDETDYYLGIVWTKFKYSPSYCAHASDNK